VEIVESQVVYLRFQGVGPRLKLAQLSWSLMMYLGLGLCPRKVLNVRLSFG